MIVRVLAAAIVATLLAAVGGLVVLALRDEPADPCPPGAMELYLEGSGGRGPTGGAAELLAEAERSHRENCATGG